MVHRLFDNQYRLLISPNPVPTSPILTISSLAARSRVQKRRRREINREMNLEFRVARDIVFSRTMRLPTCRRRWWSPQPFNRNAQIVSINRPLSFNCLLLPLLRLILAQAPLEFSSVQRQVHFCLSFSRWLSRLLGQPFFV